MKHIQQMKTTLFSLKRIYFKLTQNLKKKVNMSKGRATVATEAQLWNNWFTWINPQLTWTDFLFLALLQAKLVEPHL